MTVQEICELIKSGAIEVPTLYLQHSEEEDEDGRYDYYSGNRDLTIDDERCCIEIKCDEDVNNIDFTARSIGVTVMEYYDQEGNKIELSGDEKNALSDAIESVIELEVE